MTKNPQITSIESEIRRHLLAEPNLEIVADKLIRKYSLEKLSENDLQIFAQFLIRCGYFAGLVHFFSRALEEHHMIPWAHFAAAILMADSDVSEDIKRALVEGAEKQKSLETLSRCTLLDTFAPEMIDLRRQRKEKIQNNYQQKKEQWLSELATLKSQGLLEPEEELLMKLKRYFPEDPQILELMSELRERKALGILHKDIPYRSSWIPLEIYEPKDESTEEILHVITASMRRLIKKQASLTEDFVIAQVIWENYDAALAMIDKQKNPSLSLRWLRLEILLRSRKYLDLLQQLSSLELELAQDPESTIEILYLRAQALWGLGQKNNAVEILESIATSRPQYRSTTILLSEWKEELS